MNIPKVIETLINAQNSGDSQIYANCFSDVAIVSDEGNTYNGRIEIKEWIEKAHKKYNMLMEPVKLEETAVSSVLSVKVTGTFPGSPAILKYHMKIKNELIDSLKITG